MAAETSKHVLLVPMIMWGHTRPMCTLAARLVKLRPVSITMFVSGAFYERAKAEITKDFETGQSHLLARITLIPLKQSNSPFDSASYEADFLDTWARFMAGQSLNGYTAAGVPHKVNTSEKDHLAAAVVDMFAIRAFRELHGLKEKLRVKIFSWYPSAMSSLFYWFDEDRIPRAEEIAARTGVSFDVAAHEVVIETNGRLVQSPCLPPMYDYEYRPQAAYFPPEFSGNVLIQVHRNFRNSDGLITIDAADYHPRTTAAIRSWFAPRPAYYAGPLVSRAPRVLSTDRGAIDAMRFMHERLQSHGAKSVILISFGSMFWPPNTEKVGAVLGVLMDRNIPFILSRCSPLSVIPDETAGRLEKYDAALLSTWVPQQAVLSHAAMGWCLSHAGHNTVFECIDANVPMHDPLADRRRPAAQRHPTRGRPRHRIRAHRSAERGRPRPIYRTGRKPDGSIEAVQAEIRDVLGRAFGADGEEKRVRLDALRTKLRAAWAEGGAARKDMETFLDSL